MLPRLSSPGRCMREPFLTLSTNRGRYLVLSLLTLLLFVSSLVLGTITLYASAPRAERIKYAGIVVQFENGEVVNKCVQFNEGSLSGIEMLDRAGFDTKVDASNAMGVAVCKIGKEGCNYPNKSCFCNCQGAECKYWSYWQLIDGAWKYSDTAASNTKIKNGDVEGWRYGVGTTDSAPPPQLMTFEQVCVLPTDTPTPTETLTPTITNTPSNTETPTITLTRTQTQTRTQTLTRTATLTRTPTLSTTPRAATQTREIFPTNTRRPIPTARPQNRPPPTAEQFVPTDPPPPEIETETPRPTLLAAKRPPTRVAIGSGNGSNPGDGEETEVFREDSADVNTGRVLGIVLLGGVAVAGVGLFALVGGVLWWVFNRRT